MMTRLLLFHQLQDTTSDTQRSLFFYDTADGALLGTFVHPRPQSATENCTWHNYNVVPTPNRYVLVSGNDQAGISVVDFTNPAKARQMAFADPAPLVGPMGQSLIGGDWAADWYNGFIYESDMTRGLLVWHLNAVAPVLQLTHLNPQTQEFTIR
jgi:hypothetical protein